MTVSAPTSYVRVLGIDPSWRGFGFVVLEGGQRLVDWGVALVWSKSSEAFLARVEAFVNRYHPALIVVERLGSEVRHRRARQIAQIQAYARTVGIPVEAVSRASVRRAFEDSGTTKQQIAVAIAETFPELGCRLPVPRKPWRTEDERMNIFDALSFVLALRSLPENDLSQAA